MIEEKDIARKTSELMLRHGANLVPKHKSLFMKFLGFWSALFTRNNSFMEGMWTTVGNTIYYPSYVRQPYHKTYRETILHELVHVYQYRKVGVIPFLFLYALVPIPMYFAYFRWRWEREAYLFEIKYCNRNIDEIVELLWSKYFYTWPKKKMKKWFEDNK